MNFKVGDLVTRISHNHDILFKIVSIDSDVAILNPSSSFSIDSTFSLVFSSTLFSIAFSIKAKVILKGHTIPALLQ